ncbi:dimethylmenaquinone methyltransferase (plasmid) [Ketogulonicigenium vulgare Y25]|uniref:Putative 4-hydroxy-4-methyl-2-oxoglutarate aldolase n=3 Tax=Ketogulonicigenium vulgare TaxID=92945 RepID=F9YAV7_KETVW|nr:4-hydroxy-4-methyl-2-oxoglutarate aldolase [Ketogulonicigenium vulgare]ADO43982.1 dimethylmenaquinone methyltransferase [Ketogulonicigenium vulgare Y25]AEM42509.1 Demethylmenaquinone methyltransferase protein [Ketogulonicigenium vulgare WSH-001]ALJ82548.1 4-hydroxy-4-methyl-2-oxoglutarate aldolase [Ketogulonicigenium vulgare]AOZ53214.1 dimethylmenaquinone methyltransferase [Ketogulonicigenium vulgare]
MIPKYKINPMPPQIDAEKLARYSGVEVAMVGHFRDRGFVHRAIQPILRKPGTVVGTAVTVAIPSDDSTMLHYAIKQLRPGDFLMIDRLGDDRHAPIGGGTGQMLKLRGAAGVVIDGPCTDPDEILELDLPCWSRGFSHITTRVYNRGGAMNVPVSVGNTPVMPGDVVIADATGVIVLPPDEADAVCDHALMRQARYNDFIAKVRAGEVMPPSAAQNFVEDELKNAQI